MNKLSILHIVPWFPNSINNIEGVFIVEHIKALNNHCKNEVLHVCFGEENKLENYVDEHDINVTRITTKLLVNKWKIKELIATRKIAKYLKRNNHNYDVVNFHVAYPNAVGINQLTKKHPNLKFIITEHWTAYRMGFDLPKGHRGRTRIENIFNNDIPLFVVSNALGEDIRSFIGDSKRKYSVIPNVIDCKNFTYKPKKTNSNFIFSSINNWNPMKNPLVLIQAFNLLLKKYSNVRLILGGEGSLIPEMKDLIDELGINESIKLIGRLTKNEVVGTLHQSNVYCQSSNYETFSVICAEALITGTPVIATNIGGMKDFINEKNGVLVDDLSVNNWFLAMESKYLNYGSTNNESIAKECESKFNSKAVGELYYSNIKQFLDEE